MSYSPRYCGEIESYRSILARNIELIKNKIKRVIQNQHNKYTRKESRSQQLSFSFRNLPFSVRFQHVHVSAMTNFESVCVV